MEISFQRGSFISWCDVSIAQSLLPSSEGRDLGLEGTSS